MKSLQIIESAYRCTIEEQDDPAVWIAHVIEGAGADIGILLRGNAVNYTASNQDASGLAFGDVAHAHPPRIDSEINRFLDKGVEIYAVEEDLAVRGIGAAEMLPGIETISRQRLSELFGAYDQIWHW